MSYCISCGVRAEYAGGLCFECMQKVRNRSTLPHGSIVYTKYNPEMSKTIDFKYPESNFPEKKRRKKKRKNTIMKGELLTHADCADYSLVLYSETDEKPWKEEDITYYYIQIDVTCPTMTRIDLFQLMVDHNKKAVYFPAFDLQSRKVKRAIKVIKYLISPRDSLIESVAEELGIPYVKDV